MSKRRRRIDRKGIEKYLETMIPIEPLREESPDETTSPTAEQPITKPTTKPAPQPGSINENLLNRSVKEADRLPTISFKSVRVTAAMLYLKGTIPGFQISEFLREAASKKLSEEYPDLWKALEKVPESRRSSRLSKVIT